MILNIGVQFEFSFSYLLSIFHCLLSANFPVPCDSFPPDIHTYQYLNESNIGSCSLCQDVDVETV